MTRDRLTDYLLGALSDDERRAVEEEFMADEGAFERIRAVEADLIDAYVLGELPLESRARFETLYLVDPERRERVRVARELNAPARKTSRRAWVAGALGAAAVAAAALVLFVVPLGASSMTVRLAAPSRDVPAVAAEVPDGRGTLRLELDLAPSVSPEGLGARLRRLDGAWVEGGRLLAGPPLTLVLDRADLSPGEYRLALVRDGKPIGFYEFQVVKQ